MGSDRAEQVTYEGDTLEQAVGSAVLGAVRDKGGTIWIHAESCEETNVNSECRCGPRPVAVIPDLSAEVAFAALAAARSL